MVPGIILAAGASSRMGGHPKALLRLGGARSDQTFVSGLVKTFQAGGAEDVVVVIRTGIPELEAELRLQVPPVRIVCNQAPERGQLSSLICALDVVDRPGVQAILVTPVDLPLVSVRTIELLLQAYRRTRPLVVRPTKNGRHGHPVVFDRALFDDLRHADPGEGARGVIHAHSGSALDLAVDDEGPFLDIDTPEDYERLIGRSDPVA